MLHERFFREATEEEVAKETSLPFTRDQIEAITEECPTPFYIYDEAAIRQRAQSFRSAFAWSPDFINFFAVKALPNPHIVNILKEEGFGTDCSSEAELELARKIGLRGDKIMFTSNNTPTREFAMAQDLGAIINLDDITHLPYLERHVGLPDTLCFRFNPGPQIEGNSIIGKPEESKYGLREDQMLDACRMALAKGVRNLGIHTMVASNERSPEALRQTDKMMFGLAQRLNDIGAKISFINLGGGIGVPYELSHKPVDIQQISQQIQRDYQEMIAAQSLAPIRMMMECGRYVTGPYGYFVTKVRHIAEKYRHYIGVDGNITSFPRIAMYDAYHHLTVLGKEGAPREMVYDVTGSLCENNDKFAKERELPEIDLDDFVIVHEGGAHAIAMANEYNGRLLPAELLLKPDGSVLQIRRARTVDDYFSTITNFPGFGDLKDEVSPTLPSYIRPF